MPNILFETMTYNSALEITLYETLKKYLQKIQYIVEKGAFTSPFSIYGGSQIVRKSYNHIYIIDKSI